MNPNPDYRGAISFEEAVRQLKAGEQPRPSEFDSSLKMLNEDNLKFLRGETPHLANPKVLLLASLTVGAIAVVGFLFNVYLLLQTSQLHSSGIKTVATVINREGSSGRGTLYYVTYNFKVAGPNNQTQSYSPRVSVDPSTYQLLGIGTQVNIIYLPSDPKINEIAGNTNLEDMAVFWMLLTGLGIILLWFPITITSKQHFWYKKLEEPGSRLLKGEVTYSYEGLVKDVHSGAVEYRFTAPGGYGLNGKTNFTFDVSDKKRRLPWLGDFVIVLYQDDEHHMAL